MKENILMLKDMAKVSKFGRMENNMMVNGVWVINMELENAHLSMVLFIRENSRISISTEWGYTHGQMTRK